MSVEEEDRSSDCLVTSTPCQDSQDGATTFLHQSKPGDISLFSFPSFETFSNPLFSVVYDAPSISPTEFADIKSDSADPRAPSPSVQSVSSVASTQRLEWDSGADIGYGGLKSMFGLSTLERMAIGSCCSALKEIEPKRECMRIKSDSKDLIQRSPGDSEIGRIEVKDLESEMSNLRMHMSKLDALDEAGDQIKAYQRHLTLKEFEEDSMLPPKSMSRSTESERFDRKSDINTRITALKIAEKRSSSMNDLSEPDGKKNYYSNKFKRIHSYSTIDVSPVKQPANTPRSISSSCSAVSLNSSNTVIAPLCSNCCNGVKKKSSLQSSNASEVVMPEMSSSDNAQQCRDNNDHTSVSEIDTKSSSKKSVSCNTKVAQFVTHFVDKLCSNSGDAMKQRLLRKILDDLDVQMQIEKEEDKLLDHQHDEYSDIELQYKSSSQQMQFGRDLDDASPFVEQKPCNSPDCNVDDVGNYDLAFHGQPSSITDSTNADVSVPATEYPYLSSSERDSTSHWIEMQQLKDVESYASRSSVDSSERLNEDFVYPQRSFVRTKNQGVVMDRRTLPSTWCMFNDLKHMITAQQESLELVKESVRQQRRRNMQRLQKDMLWLKHVEGMLHAEQVKRVNADSAKYGFQDVQVQCALDEASSNLESFLTKDSGPASRCPSIFVCLPSTLTSSTPNAANNPVKHLRSAGTQTLLTQDEPFISKKEQLDTNSLDKPIISIPQTVRRMSAGCQDGKRTTSTEFLNKVLEQKQPRPVAWFLPLNDSRLGMSLEGEKVLRAKLKHIGGFRCKASMCERRNSQHILQEALQQLTPDKNPTNVKLKKAHGKTGIVNSNLPTNNNVGLEEIQGGYRKYTVPVSFSSQHHNPKYRRLSHNAMQEQTEKVYSILPEVTAKNEQKHRRNVYKTNRLMAQIFQKSLQQKVLAGRSSFITTEKCQC